MFNKASAMPLALTSWLQPCQTQKFLFSSFYLFEINFFFQVWQGPQEGYQHQRLNCRPAKLEMVQKKFLKQKINKGIKLRSFQVRRACSQVVDTDGLAVACQLWKFFKKNPKKKK
jgi:hypothetical protein